MAKSPQTQKKQILIVDDEPDLRELVALTLSRMGHGCHAAEDLRSARQLLQTQRFDLCLTDMRLPDGNGLELVEHIQLHHPALPVAMITAHGSMDSAIAALKAGAFDFVTKPVELAQLRELVEKALAPMQPLAARVAALPELARLSGDSPVMQALRSQIRKLARSQAPVHIQGESGTGKELVARLIHQLGPRGDGPFVPVNCGAIPSELMESEFFGHRKGSFSGAVEDKPGLFQAASGGTLFLDEVADLPLPMQVKLLRAIQEKRVRAIGAQQEQPVDTRILSATHKNLRALIEQGLFRDDLYYRINVIELRVPSLRERVEDIPQLAHELLARIALEYQLPPPELTSAAIERLCRHGFPGNVRELENILERAFALCEGERIEAADLLLDGESATATTTEPAERAVRPATPEAAMPAGSLEHYLEQIERQAIIGALEETRWNKTQAAKKLGITFRALRYRLKKLNLE
ncbi:MAG TPA: sigma-54 dependent transcriptional regulator [Pseudomonadales bacterium]|jgi:two-component system response regulator PilR (NtrC family)|nr:sigma-54-dependent Fis family transcriptional regulator [Pseudomonadales bacterium]HMW83851.1 sigma-54 dependent transcriptional regulator [Pseudomonadales bacterium]HMY97415.1 sigma-54 dependent transcriptional regulator [Pseudomonadales bacterium]HMZ71356.1 sigma-54 dependent transcriptional regulator [Pseudomonadales bacterium]HMZ92336.1 sigma-54 dependent transcriptional regulator [Pseudomonadales bacterium]